MDSEGRGHYACPSCGERIVVTVDASGGLRQEYVEDCPVCCRPLMLKVTLEESGRVTILARED